jgi:hypothetical protein
MNSLSSEIISIWRLNVATNVKIKILWHQIVLCVLCCSLHYGGYVFNCDGSRVCVDCELSWDRFQPLYNINLVCYWSTAVCFCSFHVTNYVKKKIKSVPETSFTCRPNFDTTVLSSDQLRVFKDRFKVSIDAHFHALLPSFLSEKETSSFYCTTMRAYVHYSRFASFDRLSRNMVEQRANAMLFNVVRSAITVRPSRALVRQLLHVFWGSDTEYGNWPWNNMRRVFKVMFRCDVK